MGNTFGTLLRITTFGESHGPAVGVVLDGCPPGVEIDAVTIQRDLDRRRPGQSAVTTQRREADKVEILSGVSAGDTVVQRGTNHAWSNRSNAPCVVAFVLIDGAFEPELAAKWGDGRA